MELPSARIKNSFFVFVFCKPVRAGLNMPDNIEVHGDGGIFIRCRMLRGIEALDAFKQGHRAE